MPEFAVSEEKNRWMQKKMAELGVREDDLCETFVRSSGNGGQHVNKTSSCVQIRHRPSGIQVSCMRERSQSVNRFLARRELLERIEAASGVPTAEMKRIAKLRKQKDRRKRRSSALTPMCNQNEYKAARKVATEAYISTPKEPPTNPTP